MFSAYTWLTASVILDTVLSTASCCPRDLHFSLVVFQSSFQWYAVYVKLESVIVKSIEKSHNHYILELQNFLFSNYRPHSGEGCGEVMFLHLSVCPQRGTSSSVLVLSGGMPSSVMVLSGSSPQLCWGGWEEYPLFLSRSTPGPVQGYPLVLSGVLLTRAEGLSCWVQNLLNSHRRSSTIELYRSC